MGGVKVSLHAFLTSAPDVKDIGYRTRPLYSRRKQSTVTIGCEVTWAPELVWTLYLPSLTNRMQILRSSNPYPSHYTD
jgi:hypothetical protein